MLKLGFCFFVDFLTLPIEKRTRRGRKETRRSCQEQKEKQKEGQFLRQVRKYQFE